MKLNATSAAILSAILIRAETGIAQNAREYLEGNGLIPGWGISYPVPYYHAVFTLPHLLHSIIHYNNELIYNLLFSSSSETLLAFGRDPKWLGGEIGFYGILQT